MKGPFWALASSWMSSTSAAAGLAAIGAIANLIGGAVMVNAYGIINERTGSYTLAMLPLATLCVAGGIAVLIMGRQARNAQLHENRSRISDDKSGTRVRFSLTVFFRCIARFPVELLTEGLAGPIFCDRRLAVSCIN